MNAVDRVDFSKKAEPLRFIELGTGRIGNPRKLKRDCCRFESSRMLVVALQPGGRVVVHPGGRTSSDKKKTYRYTGNEIWTAVP
ncbi:MAG: hypothetical protein HGB18_00465 [Candidatus Moranbacteria bacterium]|nr:hypothetical protein [Candidatus Moranbacteria bacterium]